ncbi:glycine-rich RNA-binding protein 10-like [Pecten maximus]|uniref:glycine-rich RNA-binding protein 10-like n=1 Tax=Pecten maximus TaxID=6579 RepID=UPI0014590F6F|nr:glycine-rich RNA-binding protein 10-like [Pecten maximus]
MDDDGCRVYAGNLSFDTEELSLQKAFSQYGKVVDCKLITDRDTGRSRGFGFITFDSPESAKNAVDGALELDGRGLKISIAQARGGGGGGRGRGGYRGGGGGYQYQQREQRSSYGRDNGHNYGPGGGGYGGGAYGGGNRGGDGYGRRDGGW